VNGCSGLRAKSYRPIIRRTGYKLTDHSINKAMTYNDFRPARREKKGRRPRPGEMVVIGELYKRMFGELPSRTLRN